MLEDVRMLESVKNEVLDNYLSFGWYRMGNLIFTTNSLRPNPEGPTHRVFWLRYRVHDVATEGKIRKILNSNACFTVQYRPFTLNKELIQLHKLYYESLEFPTANNLRDLLVDIKNDVYDSWLVEVRDEGRLIGAGIFDKGDDTIAGIVNIYDPEYKKYSPGKFLMLMKHKFCIKNNLTYYYPGYYSPDYPVFDYKLFLDKDATEVFIPGLNVWLPYPRFETIITAKS